MGHPFKRGKHPAWLTKQKLADGGSVDSSPPDYSDLPPDIAAQLRPEYDKALASTRNALAYQQASSPSIKPIGPTGRERINPDGSVSGFSKGGKISGKRR